MENHEALHQKNSAAATAAKNGENNTRVQ